MKEKFMLKNYLLQFKNLEKYFLKFNKNFKKYKK